MKLKKRMVLTCLLCSWAAGAVQAKYPVAGVKPYARPEGAPVVTATNHDNKWLEQAMTGVEKPYPKSLQFMQNQGNWYTPFAIPGMRGPYDIRGWHK